MCDGNNVNDRKPIFEKLITEFSKRSSMLWKGSKVVFEMEKLDDNLATKHISSLAIDSFKRFSKVKKE